MTVILPLPSISALRWSMFRWLRMARTWIWWKDLWQRMTALRVSGACRSIPIRPEPAIPMRLSAALQDWNRPLRISVFTGIMLMAYIIYTITIRTTWSRSWQSVSVPATRIWFTNSLPPQKSVSRVPVLQPSQPPATTWRILRSSWNSRPSAMIR